MPTHSSSISKMPLPSPTSRKLALLLFSILSSPPKVRLPCALRINAPVTRTGIEDLHSLLESSAAPDYIILPKCDSPAFISMVRALLDQAAKETEIIALIESAKGVEALPDIVSSDVRPVALLFGAADMEADLGAKTGWETLLFVRSRIIQVAASAGIVAVDSPFFDIADLEGLKRETTAATGFRFSQQGCNPSKADLRH